MKNKVFLYWFKDEKVGKNFGDELSAYLIERLFHVKVEYLPVPASRSRMLVRGVRMLLKGQLNWIDFLQTLKGVIRGEYVVAIGSILGYTSGKNATIWGSGLMRKTDVVKPSNFLAVRGKKTQERLKELGLTPPEAIGDPALLTNLVYDPEVEVQFDLGIIPHYSHYNELNKLSSDTILVINLLDPIEEVIKKIKSCKKTISTSLHGIIISHTYSIPSLWMQLDEKPLHGDTFKFEDYFSSVGIRLYEPLVYKDIINFTSNSLDDLFARYSKEAIIQNDLSEIQQQLLKVATF